MEAATELLVGVLTRDSRRTLPRLLRSLQNQTLPAALWRVVFIDHDSRDGSLEMLERFVDENDNALLLRGERADLTKSRQRLIEECDCRWIAFVDPEMVLPDEWLARAFAVLHSPSTAALAGIGGPLRISAQADSLRPLRLMQDSFIGWPGLEELEIFDNERYTRHLPGGAVVYSRAAVSAAGGFDAAYGAQAGGELDLGARLARKGFKLMVHPALEAIHLLSVSSRRAWLLRAFRFGRARVRVASRNPEEMRDIRFWLPLSFVALQILFFMIGFSYAASSQSPFDVSVIAGLLAVAALAGLDFLLALLCYWPYWRRGSGSLVVSAGALTVATHFAYAWGEMCSVVEVALAQGSPRANWAQFASRWVMRWTGRLSKRPVG